MFPMALMASGKLSLTGSLYKDRAIAASVIKDSAGSFRNDNVSYRSKWGAFGMSLLVPGAGQIYNGGYIKAAAFLAVETAAIVVGLKYNKKGDDKTDEFQNYALAHWSPYRYAKWTVAHAKEINSDVDVSGYNIFLGGQKVSWAEIHRLESALGAWYSHQLPTMSSQQYFELIGKYPQFASGWDQFGDENTAYTYGDPLPKQFLDYSKERGKANDYYNVASKAVIFLVLNHIASAAEAYIDANRQNKLRLGLSIEPDRLGLYQPNLNMSFNF